MKLATILFLSFSIFALEKYESTEYKGLSKFQRIGKVEEYMTKLSKELNDQVKANLKNLTKEVETLKKANAENESKDFSQEISALQTQIQTKIAEIEQKHTDDIALVREEIKKAIADEKKAREAMAKSLLNQILAIQKIQTKMENTKNAPPIKTPTL
jgi:phage host-nuclease inhibitor protein Gam